MTEIVISNLISDSSKGTDYTTAFNEAIEKCSKSGGGKGPWSETISATITV